MPTTETAADGMTLFQIAEAAGDVMAARGISTEGLAHLAGLPEATVLDFLDAVPVDPGDHALLLMVLTTPMPAEAKACGLPEPEEFL